MEGQESPRAVVLLSGGVDSAALAALYLSQGWKVSALFVDYGQLARAEEESASRAVAEHLGIPVDVLRVEGMPAWPPSKPMPARNAFLVLAALASVGDTVHVLGIGIHSGGGYWDTSPDFHRAIQRLVDGYTFGVVLVGAPFLEWTKREVVSYARSQGLPLDRTYSCELPAGPCGRCASCKGLSVAAA